MKFFKFTDYIKSWSVWVLGALAALPQINDHLQIVAQDSASLYYSALALVGLVVRAIKQTPETAPATATAKKSGKGGK